MENEAVGSRMRNGAWVMVEDKGQFCHWEDAEEGLGSLRFNAGGGRLCINMTLPALKFKRLEQEYRHLSAPYQAADHSKRDTDD